MSNHAPPLKMIKDPDGRIEYRTLCGQFVCSDLRTQAQRDEERYQADLLGQGDEWVYEQMQWLIQKSRAFRVDNFVVPNKTTGGPG